jgi:hypothetical protein
MKFRIDREVLGFSGHQAFECEAVPKRRPLKSSKTLNIINFSLPGILQTNIVNLGLESVQCKEWFLSPT